MLLSAVFAECLAALPAATRPISSLAREPLSPECLRTMQDVEQMDCACAAWLTPMLCARVAGSTHVNTMRTNEMELRINDEDNANNGICAHTSCDSHAGTAWSLSLVGGALVRGGMEVMRAESGDASDGTAREDCDAQITSALKSHRTSHAAHAAAVAATSAWQDPGTNY